MLLRLAFAISFSLALLFLTLQFFLSPLYLEMEYEFAGFPPARPLTSDQRYVAAQSFLSYLNVEMGGATLLGLSELRFDSQPFFNENDLRCILRAKEVRGTAFGLTFGLGALSIALALFIAVDDFERARVAVIRSALAAFLLYTLLSLLARFAFDALRPALLALISSPGCQPSAASGLALIFPPAIFRDGLVLLALFVRLEALALALLAWLFGLISRPRKTTNQKA